jgi:phosphatidylserine/phosphatidylglycerophosphate/cardiolipin synthase-like enzyme
MRTRQIIWLVVVLAMAVLVWRTQQPQQTGPAARQKLSPSAFAPKAQTGARAGQQASNSTVRSENHYSPEENLEQIDLLQIEAAQRSLDIAMYAFTDKYLAEAILRAARRGVQVRVYRDRQQFEDEQRKAGEHNNDSTTDMFRGERNIQVRVKNRRELMHLKSYCVDGTWLRDGSANWSASGLKRQDNNARFTADPAEVQGFERVFEDMWARDNEVVQ